MAHGNFLRLLLVLERTCGALVGELGALEMDTHAARTKAQAILLGHPVANLGRSPRAGAFADRGADSFQHGRGELGGVAAAGLVGEGVKATGNEGFDPGADGLLVELEVARDLGHTPGGIREADHFEAITRVGGEARLPRAALEFVTVVIGQGDAVPGQQPTRFYELCPATHLAQIMGHDSLDTTLLYVRGSRRDLQREVEKIAWT